MHTLIDSFREEEKREINHHGTRVNTTDLVAVDSANKKNRVEPIPKVIEVNEKPTPPFSAQRLRE